MYLLLGGDDVPADTLPGVANNFGNLCLALCTTWTFADHGVNFGGRPWAKIEVYYAKASGHLTPQAAIKTNLSQ